MKQHMIDFLRKHDACEDGFDWACANCDSMTQVWAAAKPDWLVWLAVRNGVLTDRELHEFELWCALQVEHLMTDERSRNALRVKRLWLDGLATDEELSAANADAYDAVYDYASRAASDASADYAVYAAYAAARAASAAYAAKDAAYYASSTAQAAWLRENTNPKFDL